MGVRIPVQTREQKEGKWQLWVHAHLIALKCCNTFEDLTTKKVKQFLEMQVYKECKMGELRRENLGKRCAVNEEDNMGTSRKKDPVGSTCSLLHSSHKGGSNSDVSLKWEGREHIAFKSLTN